MGWKHQLRLVFKFLRLTDSPLWREADRAVQRVMAHHELQKASGNQELLSFCPRCGQLPDGDRRMEEARELFLEKWPALPPKRSELDFALAWAYFKRKI